MYIKDFGTYLYAEKLVVPEVIPIGWLDTTHNFPTGNVPNEVIEKIGQMLVEGQDVNLMRNLVFCSLCDGKQIRMTIQNKEILFLRSEIWIKDKNNRIYASPTLIYHYIVTHSYLPPQQYIDTVRQFDIKTDWDAEKELDEILRRHNR